VLIKDTDNGLGTIYKNSKVLEQSELSETKRNIKLLVSQWLLTVALSLLMHLMIVASDWQC